MFSENDIKLKITVVNFNIHQYVRIKVDNKWVDVDMWGEKFGVPFGKHAFLKQ